MITQVNLYPVSNRVVVFSDVIGRMEDTVTRREMSRLVRAWSSDTRFELVAEYRNQLKIYGRKLKEDE